MSSEVETSLPLYPVKVKDGKPGLTDYVNCVAALTALEMTIERSRQICFVAATSFLSVYLRVPVRSVAKAGALVV